MTTTDMTEGKSLGIYIHIPFCIRKCLYCDFCSFTGCDDGIKQAYVAELCRRIAVNSRECRGYTVDTVYIGGGTPTLLSVRDLCALVQAVRDNYRVSEDCEISCECNPATGSTEYFWALRQLVNRLSIGLQSFNNNELRVLGRVHDADGFERTFYDARCAGFDNISVDLMYGIPEQTVSSFAKTLEKAVLTAPEHISAYDLKIEDSTPFGKMRATLTLPDEDAELEMYSLCGEILGGTGYSKYELSNFAREGRESRHNLRYWLGEEYLGFGVAAHSYFGGRRFSQSRDISAFVRGEDILDYSEYIDRKKEQTEYVMLRMRLARGVDTENFAKRFGVEFESIYAGIMKYIQSGHIIHDGNVYRFSDRGFFISNYILSDILDFG